jgi:serine/threonine-protein kinase
MSPEQLDSARDVDARADVWALGVVLFELLTGNTPFQGETIPQLVAAVLMEAPVRMTDLPVVLPDGLIEVIQRALAKQRDRRFGSVAELAVALAPYAPPLARMSISRVRRLIDSKPPTLTPAADSPAGESTPNPLGVTPPGRSVQESQSIGGVPLSGASLASQSQSRRWLPLTLGLLFIAAGAGFFLWRRGVVSPHGQHSPVVADEAPAATVQPRMLPEPSAPQAPNTVAVSVAGTGVGVAGAAAAAVAEVPVSTPVGRTDAISPSATQEPASAVRPSSRSPAKAAAAEPAHSKPSTKTSRSSEARPESAPPSSISDFGGRR